MATVILNPYAPSYEEFTGGLIKLNLFPGLTEIKPDQLKIGKPKAIENGGNNPGETQVTLYGLAKPFINEGTLLYTRINIDQVISDKKEDIVDFSHMLYSDFAKSEESAAEVVNFLYGTLINGEEVVIDTAEKVTTDEAAGTELWRVQLNLESGINLYGKITAQVTFKTPESATYDLKELPVTAVDMYTI